MVQQTKIGVRIFQYILLIALTLITLLPLIWMLSASFKLSTEVFSNPIRWIPETFHWDNYLKIWEKVDFALFTKNSAKLTILVTIIQLFTCSFAAYGFTKCKFPGRDTLFLCYVATIAIPWQIFMLPQYIMMQKFNLVDSHLGYVLLSSNELLEAARIDGLSEYGIYFRIVLPLAKPAMATLAIFTFVNVWNDFMGPMIYFNSESNKTIPLGIRMFVGQYSTDYQLIMAASVGSLIPVIIMYAFCQRYFVQGIASSGLKG